MKIQLFTFLFVLNSFALFAQDKNIWISFWNSDSTLQGYKDKNGIIKIEPKFSGFSNATKFENIIAVSEERNGVFSNYYLTKSGTVVGRDSLHIFDNGADCESEGFIRFRDNTNDKVGMFNRAGKIVVPAIYNELTRVRNGMIIALKGAKKENWEKEKHAGCNHFTWKGGMEILIDTLNNTLVENFAYSNSIDFFSFQKTNSMPADTTRISFLAKDNSYYSFIDFEKEFKQWINKELQNNLTEQRLLAIAYDSIVYETPDGWATAIKQKYIKENFSSIKTALLETLNAKTDYFIAAGDLNPFMFEGAAFEKYYNNCGEPKDWIYPTMTVIISHKIKDDFTQNHYEFLRTDTGYKLISVAVSN